MRRFTTEPLREIEGWLAARLEGGAGGSRVSFLAPDPDLGAAAYAGETVLVEGSAARHRGYRAWVDLAELLGCRMLTPRECPGDPGMVRLVFEKLDASDSFHDDHTADVTEKYGEASRFARIDKLEEPSFLLGLRGALRAVGVGPGSRVLDLGINAGDEFELLRGILGGDAFASLELVGVDHCASAVAVAAARFRAPAHRVLLHDINRLGDLDLGRFDLIMSVGTLHSPGIEDGNGLLMRLVQENLARPGALILGFPNCRWIGGEAVYGARTRNYSHPELSLLFKDVGFCRRYLQQHRFKVTVTGKSYVFITARG